MPSVSGAMTTTNLLSDQLSIELGDTIAMLEPSANPLTVLSRKVAHRATEAVSFSWLEESSKARFLEVEGSQTSGDTAVEVVAGQGTYVQQWDQLLNTRTGEQIRVDAVATDTLTVTRGVGSTAASMNDADELYLIGTAQPENDTSKPPRSDVPSKVTNYTQIFRTPWELSDSLRASGNQVSPNEWSRQARNKGIEHAKDIELSLLFGRKSTSTPGSTQLRTTGGVLSFISTNQTDAGGDLSEAEWNAFLATAMRYGTGQKILLASATGVSALNKFPASKQQTTNSERTYGMDVTQYSSPFGSVNLVYHPLLEGDKYGGYIILLDMSQVTYRYLSANGISRDTKTRTNIQPNDQDGRKDEIITEAGLEFGLEKRHAVLTGITS